MLRKGSIPFMFNKNRKAIFQCIMTTFLVIRLGHCNFYKFFKLKEPDLFSSSSTNCCTRNFLEKKGGWWDCWAQNKGITYTYSRITPGKKSIWKIIRCHVYTFAISVDQFCASAVVSFSSDWGNELNDGKINKTMSHFRVPTLVVKQYAVPFKVILQSFVDQDDVKNS